MFQGFSSAITIVQGDREAIAADDRGDVRQRALSRLARRPLRHKITPIAKPFTPGVTQDLLGQATCGALVIVYHTPMPMGRKRRRHDQVVWQSLTA